MAEELPLKQEKKEVPFIKKEKDLKVNRQLYPEWAPKDDVRRVEKMVSALSKRVDNLKDNRESQSQQIVPAAPTIINQIPPPEGDGYWWVKLVPLAVGLIGLGLQLLKKAPEAEEEEE